MVMVGLVGVGAIILSAFKLEDSVNALGHMHSVGGERLKSLQEMDKTLANIRTLGLKHLSSESAKEMRSIESEWADLRQTVNMQYEALRQKGEKLGQIDLENVAALGKLSKEYLAQVGKALELSADFEKESAFEVLSRADQVHVSNMRDVMQRLMMHAFENVAESREELMTSAAANLRMTILIGILGGSLVLVIAFYVTKRTVIRLAELLSWSHRIAGGDLSNPLRSSSNDEVGQLMQAMGLMVGSLATARDELEIAKSTAERTATELRLYANAFHSSGEAMLITDQDNRILNINPAFTTQTGYQLDEVYGQNPRMLSCDKTPQSTFKEMWGELERNGYWQGELWDRRKTGEIYPKWASISVIRDESQIVKYYIATYSDITERKANEARIQYLAHHDPLTGLINRYNLESRLEQVLLSAHRDKLHVAIMFIDMDRFKVINDTLGHHVGDQLLIEISRRLIEGVRESDIVARLGGDEFVVVLTGMAADLDSALIAEKLLNKLGGPYSVEGNVLHTTPSIGIAVFPVDGEDGTTLMKHADTAMYHAKALGRNNLQFFTEEMNVAASERMELEKELREALDEGLLTLHYQPQIHAKSMQVSGVEALIRWQHPIHGDIAPLKFIPIAEESGLMETLGNWVIEEACRQLRIWRSEGIDSLRVAVNLSSHQLRSEKFAENVAEKLKRHGLSGRDIEFELTESAAMENPEQAIAQLQRLRELGLQLAIDDFGTGYSSLGYLKRLPIQVLKLDRVFVQDIEHDQSDADISAATIALAHNLGLRVVAEGVETEAQRDFLLKHDCDHFQGYLYSKPLPADEAKDFIRLHRGGSLRIA